MPRRQVVVTSDQSLIADTVGAALAGPDLVVTRLPWRVESGRVPHPRTREAAEVGVLLCDLQPLPRLGEAQAVVQRLAIPWIVLTGAERGPLWGAVLEAGAVAVLSNTCSLDELRRALDRVRSGEHLLTSGDVVALRAAWRAVDREQRLAVDQVRSLTPRETAVLGLMHAGESVQEIAEAFGVSEATVRSQVRAVLRKLDVNTQLAAVAAYQSASESVEPPGRTP
jgi:DNA-binding NarL/FixJ family response regulator